MEIMKSIIIKTSQIWFKRIGLVPQSRKKGIYFNSHERDNVLEYHANFWKK